MIKIGVIGCGKWSKTVIKEINKSNRFKLKAIVCRSQNKIVENKNIDIFNNVNDLIESNKCNCLYVAADPSVNFEIVNFIKEKPIPIILEKPFSNNYNQAKEMQEMVLKNNILLMINLPNIYSECFNEIKKIINSNLENLKEVKIVEGDFGPFRDNINPIWDWGYHSFSTLIDIFGYESISDIKINEMKKNRLGKDLVSKFNFKINSKIKVKVVNGNLFKHKIRKMKIYFNNYDVYEFDMINHIIFKNKNVIYSNKSSPLEALLNIFYININKKLNTEVSRIKTACLTSKFLENFYKC